MAATLRRRRHSGNVVFALAVGLLAVTVRGEEPPPAPPADVRTRPWPGVLPDPRQGFRAEKEFDPVWLCTRILDAETGLPVPGARFSRYPERIGGDLLKPGYLLDVVNADDMGFAWMEARSHHWSAESHWIAMAPGYAPSHEYGRWPEPETVLRRGVQWSGRVLDPLGAPASGATVEVFPGCGHSPAVRRATTDAEGRFTLRDVRPDGGTLWIAGVDGFARYRQPGSHPSLGDRGRDLVLETGWTATGRVLDLAGEPLAGVIVRSWQEQRGPATGTDGDGRFTLRGVEPGHALEFYLPVEREGRAILDDDSWADGVPFTVHLAPTGLVDPPDDDATLVVRSVDAATGGPLEGVRFAITGADGLRREATTATAEDVADAEDGEEDEEATPVVAGTARVPLSAGRWIVTPAGPLAEHEFEPATAAPARGGAVEVVLRVAARPRLAVEGTIPEGSDVALVVRGAEAEARDHDEDEGPWRPALPADGDAVLRVALPHDGPTLLFPVDPARDGVRTVRVDCPEPTVLRVPGWVRRLELFHGRVPAALERVDDEWLTWATGRLRLRARSAGDFIIAGARPDLVLETEIVIPAEGGGVAEPDLPRERGRPRLSGIVRVEVEAGAARDVRFEELEGDMERPAEDAAVVHAEPGSLVRVEREGWMPLMVAVRDGEQSVRWGDASLALALEDATGSPADALACVDGVVFEADGGRVVVRGLAAGPHRVRAALRDEPRGGREADVVLAAGAAAEVRLVLGEP